MKQLKIKKIQKDGDVFAVTFALNRGVYAEDFDLDQLGNDIMVISSCEDMVMVQGQVLLMAGDSITDEKGGSPVIGEARKAASTVNMSIRKESDYRDAFGQKKTGAGET